MYKYTIFWYLLSKGLSNLFPGLLENPNVKLFSFSGSKHSGDTLGECLPYLFIQGVLYFVLKIC